MKIENAVPHIGALVTGLDVKRMTNSEWQTLYQTWLDRHVLIVRGLTAAPCIRPPAAMRRTSGASIGAPRSCSERH